MDIDRYLEHTNTYILEYINVFLQFLCIELLIDINLIDITVCVALCDMIKSIHRYSYFILIACSFFLT